MIVFDFFVIFMFLPQFIFTAKDNFCIILWSKKFLNL